MRRTGDIIYPRAASAFLPRPFTDLTELRSQLASAPADTVAALYGPGGFVGLARNDSTLGVRSVGTWYLYNADDTTIPDAEISLVDTAAQPTWGTAGAVGTGGLVLDGSGGVLLDGLGYQPGHSAMVAALAYPTLTSEADGQMIGVGLISEGEDRGILGGIRRSGGAWESAHNTRNSSSWALGSSGGTARSPATDREQLLGFDGIAGDWGASADGVGADSDCIAGGYAGETDSANHSSLLGNPNHRFGSGDLLIAAYAEDATGDITLRLTHIFAGGLDRLGGVTP